MNIIASQHSSCDLRKHGTVTNNNHSRVVQKFDSQPHTDFAQSNSAGRKHFDKYHGSCKKHRPSTLSSPDILPLLTSTIPFSTIIANISREITNNYEDAITTISSILKTIPTSMNKDSLDSTDSKGKKSHSISQVFLHSSSETTGFEIDTHTAHMLVAVVHQDVDTNI